MATGWICLHRKILDSDIWNYDSEPYTRREAWIYLLLNVSRKEHKSIIGGQIVQINRGEYLVSLRYLAQAWRWSINRVKRYLTTLEGLEMITTKTEKNGTRIIVVNYGVYQNYLKGDEYTDEYSNEYTHEYSDGTPTNTPTNTKYNNINKRKQEVTKGNNKAVVYYPNDELLNKAFTDYVDMRKKIKKPMTDEAVRLAIKKLDNLSGGDNDKAIKILEQSIMNSWQGLFPLKQTEGTVDWSKV